MTQAITVQPGCAVAEDFDDTYFSRQDGWAETQHVFLEGNSLPQRWENRGETPFVVAELGFGTGLNLLATIHAWQAAGEPCPLRYISFEQVWLTPAERVAVLSVWPTLTPLVEALNTALPAAPVDTFTTVQVAGVEVTLGWGDARFIVPLWHEQADAWYLDGFKPATNEDLWEAALLEDVYHHTVAGGTFATYTAAGWVRRNLQEAGFQLEKVPGYGHKREMVRGIKAD